MCRILFREYVLFVFRKNDLYSCTFNDKSFNLFTCMDCTIDARTIIKFRVQLGYKIGYDKCYNKLESLRSQKRALFQARGLNFRRVASLNSFIV